jgi:ferritin-like metal-binding protein YciE
MVALEAHIEQALDGQVKHPGEYSEAAAAIQRFHTMVRGQRDALRAHLKTIGGSESHPIKETVSTLFGAAAGMIDNMRTEAVSKMLRDDYTAFNHAAISYGMLHATAHALGDMSTMQIADQHLRGYAKAAQEINQLIAGAVVWELSKDGLAVDQQAVQHCTEAINRAWRETTPGDMSTSSTSTRMAA